MVCHSGDHHVMLGCFKQILRDVLLDFRDRHRFMSSSLSGPAKDRLPISARLRALDLAFRDIIENAKFANAQAILWLRRVSQSFDPALAFLPRLEPKMCFYGSPDCTSVATVILRNCSQLGHNQDLVTHAAGAANSQANAIAESSCEARNRRSPRRRPACAFARDPCRPLGHRRSVPSPD